MSSGGALCCSLGEYLFRTSTGTWIQSPTADTDLVNVSVNSYPIFLQEMMMDITKLIRIGNQRTQELAEIDLELNGKSESRYLKNPANVGLYRQYLDMFPSSDIITSTKLYTFDV